MRAEDVKLMREFIEKSTRRAKVMMEPYRLELVSLQKMQENLEAVCGHEDERATGVHGHNDSEWYCPDCKRTYWL